MHRLRRVARHPVDRLYLAWWRLRGWPRQTIPEMRAMADVLLRSPTPLRVFEWGSGYSTSYYSRLLTRAGRPYEWHSIDHTPGWQERVRRRIGDNPHVHLHCVPFRNPWAIGVCSLAEHPEAAEAERYISFPGTLGGQFDVIFVDGRFRRRCLHVAREVVKPSGVVLLHDAQRTHYADAARRLFARSELVTGGYIPGVHQPYASQLLIAWPTEPDLSS